MPRKSRDRIDSKSMAVTRYLLTCACGRAISVASSQAGSTISCPDCGAAVDIPTIRGLRDLPIDEKPADRETVSTSSKSSWSLLLGLTAGICFLSLLISLGIGSYLGLQRIANPTPFTLEDELAYGDDMINSYQPSDLWDIWTFYRVEGLTIKKPSVYFETKRLLEVRDRWIWVSFITSAVALVGFIGTILVARGKR